MNTAFLKSFLALSQIYNDGAFSSITLNNSLKNCKAKDKALVTKIVYGVLDNDIRLDYIIGKHVKKMPKGDALLYLKIGAYCLAELSIPVYAVVNDVAELAKNSGDRRIVGFVNATLKTLADVLPDFDDYPTDEIEAASVRYSYPLWAVKKLVKDYGKETALKIVSAKHDTATTVRFSAPVNASEVSARFGSEVRPTVFPDAFFVDGRVGAPDETFTVQSLGSMCVSRVCAAFNPKNMLDCCSAPGGKAVYVKQLCASANVTACDIHPHRVALIQAYAKRLGVDVTIKVADATQFDESLAGKFDLVLCDVPCSGFGVLDNHPDIKIFRKNEDIGTLMKLQRAILGNACRYVADGGVLVYSTCTVFDNENGQQVRRFLAEHPDFAPEKITLPQFPEADGQTQHQFLPSEVMQGFFVAAMRKTNTTSR